MTSVPAAAHVKQPPSGAEESSHVGVSTSAVSLSSCSTTAPLLDCPSFNQFHKNLTGFVLADVLLFHRQCAPMRSCRAAQVERLLELPPSPISPEPERKGKEHQFWLSASSDHSSNLPEILEDPKPVVALLLLHLVRSSSSRGSRRSYGVDTFATTTSASWFTSADLSESPSPACPPYRSLLWKHRCCRSDAAHSPSHSADCTTSSTAATSIFGVRRPEEAKNSQLGSSTPSLTSSHILDASP